ncbi:MAG: dihydrofolate reductase [Chloroflexi bacterium]|nr:dihydrofolate reductase [Chloroflexota bacterium]
MGWDGGLPWHLTDDLKHFKRRTMGHHLILGRKTFDGLDVTLSGRSLIVLSRDASYKAEGAQVAGSLAEALALAEAAGEDEAFVGGGAEVFAEALAGADRLYLTRVEAEVEADVFFPELDENKWELLGEEAFVQGRKNDFGFAIQVLGRAK